MRQFTAILMTLSFVFLTVLFNFGAVYVDDMDKIENNAVKNYENLTNIERDGALQNLADSSFMAIADVQKAKGSVIYKASGANSIAVNTYSSTGTTVYKTDNGSFVLDAKVGSIPTTLTAMYSAQTNRIYILNGAATDYLTYDNAKKYYIFKTTAERPNDLVPYGAAIYTSIDGSNFKLQPQQKLQSIYHSGAKVYMESWTAKIPENTKSIKVEVNGVSIIDDYNSIEKHSQKNVDMTMLSNVNISGDNLVLGVKEELIENVEIKPPSPIQPVEDKVTKIEPIKKETVKKETVKKETVKKETTKKLAEDIEVKTKADKTTEKTAETNQEDKKEIVEKPKVSTKTIYSAPKETETTKKLPKIEIVQEDIAEVESYEDEIVNEQQVYYVEQPEAKENNFSKIIIAYIIILLSIIMIIFIRSTLSIKKHN